MVLQTTTSTHLFTALGRCTFICWQSIAGQLTTRLHTKTVYITAFSVHFNAFRQK